MFHGIEYGILHNECGICVRYNHVMYDNHYIMNAAYVSGIIT